ncbi:chromosome partition protein Smc [Leucobacter sp. Psy1]|uniref:AAA family ATPase n=1 Tax=Leucobacter sp. Psy1 TaxID=2875729 RepID=UPI001CD1CC76|nr:AAA family ATPase [Leucobacter sp. Psy1]UBH06222.1 chromosome partition protein Smc [Leucobacter sp. Psy1]
MHLKSLTLKGFKSFAQSTTFEFEPGVTAIVGPNGSGKSNVVDALAWVMGEQGAKTLRGGKMEDVIFAGTSTRGPLGRAEVKLTIDNSDGALPIEYSEVTISRTLFRNGSSEYAINGENCRLLDVQELLSDSGLGREMHVIVGQGQLDAVLRATPEDRRGFIEEAAGVLKHRRRKERTLRKLDAMETNLTRLNDLAGEIRRQLKPLGKQAEVAKQAQTIAAEVRDAQARLLADDVARLRAELNDLAKAESEQHSERIVLQEQVEQKQLRISRLEQEQQSEELDGARRVTLALESVQSRLRSLYSAAQQRLTFLATQAEAPEQANRITRASVEEAAEEERALAELIPVAERAWEDASAATRKARTALDATDEHIAAQSALVSKHDLRLTELRGRVETAEKQRDAVAQEVHRREQAVTQAEERAAEATQRLSAFEAEHGEAAADAQDGEPEGLDHAYRVAQEQQSAAETERDETRERLHALEQERAGLDARISALARSLDQRDASGAVLERATTGLLGRVADHVRTRDGYEAAIGAALGSFADALLAADAQAADAAVSSAHRDDLGRLDVVIARPATAPESSAPTTAHAVRAVDVIDAPAGVAGLLSRSYIAEDLENARQAADELRTVLPRGSFTVVTSTGDVLTEFTLTGGSGLAPSRIELTVDRENAERRRDEVSAEIDDANALLAEQRERAARAKREVQDAYTELRAADARLAEFAKQRQQLTVRAEAGQAEAARARQALAEVTGSVEQAEAAVSRAAHDLAEAEATPRPMLDAGQRDALQVELEQARAAEMERRLELETARERARAAESRTRALREQFAAERAAAEEAAKRAVLRSRQAARAEGVTRVLPGILDSCGRSLEEARAAQRKAEEERARNSQELTLLRSEEAELRHRLQQITERVHGAELKSYERKLQLSSLLERSGNELGLVEDVLIAEYGPDQLIPVLDAGVEEAQADGPEPAESAATTGTDHGYANDLEAELARELGLDGDSGNAAGEEGQTEGAPDTSAGSPSQADSEAPTGTPFVRAEQEKRLARAQRQLSQLGRINPLALEEYAALEQRHRFLADQLADLTRTRADLMRIIEELDEKMQGIFAAAFADTQEAFARVFPILFPGGSGDISLSDPDNILSTGIDMAVRPAGKRVERLSLLSGGERSLAAVAWLIAIFQARPSPFYIMDEVEAALDDANLGRLLQVFETLRENSQLIVITHQKRTMEIADALYGVSMREDGISAVVGQRIAA